MLGFLNALFESALVKILSILLILGICFGAPYYIPWLESTYLGQRLIDSGIWPDNMVLWPYETGMKIITLGTIGVILSGYLAIALVAIWIIIMAIIFIVTLIGLIRQKIRERKFVSMMRQEEAKRKSMKNDAPAGYRRKGNGKLVRVKS